jgi:phage shock protein A
MSELAAPSNVPTLGEVRDKIEQRYSVALGQAELAQDSVAGRKLEIERATVNLKGSARLQEIRASLDAEKAGTSGPQAVEGGERPAIGSQPPSTSALPNEASKAPDQA